MKCRGIRGAITVEANTREHVLAATKELLQEMVSANGVEEDDIACIIFTTTTDIDAEFPAVAARGLGFTQTALMCWHEMNVPGSLPMCLRILILFNTEKHAHEVVHVYLKGAQGLRTPKMEERGEMR
jgi:chorismate mutase